MKYRVLGKTGIKVSEISFGAWVISGMWGEQDDKESLNVMNAAIDKGVNFIDTAALYGDGRSERLISKLTKSRKERIYICTKTPPLPEDYTQAPWPPSPYCIAQERYPEAYIRKNVEERLTNLGMECIDILMLHTWTRAWNKNPYPLDTLEKLKKEGKIRFYGVSTAEHDQNCLNDLVRKELIDVTMVAFNIFEQEPAAELFPDAIDHNIGVIGRVPFDEGSLCDIFDENTKFAEDDWRGNYFSGDRLSRTVKRVENLKKDVKEILADLKVTLAQLALLFVLNQNAISTVIPGMRRLQEVEWNTSVSDMKPLSADIIKILQKHAWNRGFWYLG